MGDHQQQSTPSGSRHRRGCAHNSASSNSLSGNASRQPCGGRASPVSPGSVMLMMDLRANQEDEDGDGGSSILGGGSDADSLLAMRGCNAGSHHSRTIEAASGSANFITDDDEEVIQE